MADEKTYSESEHIAILSDRVATETASLTEERDELATSKTELETKLDVTESEKVAALKRAEDAEKALEDFKAEVETEREAASRKDERLTQVREAAKHMGEDFFTDETRIKRIVAMDEDSFTGYLADLTATATGVGAPTGAPRETAMAGGKGEQRELASAGRSFLLGDFTTKGD